MAPGGRKLLLFGHLVFSIGWIGAAVSYIALGVAAELSRSAETVRAAWIGMELVGWWVIVPLAVTSLSSGVVMGLGTRWGLFRHYWVVFSLALTTVATVVLVQHMPTVSDTAAFARAAEPGQVVTIGGDVGHPAIGLVLLLVVMGMNIYKPKGLTAYGRRVERWNKMAG